VGGSDKQFLKVLDLSHNGIQSKLLDFSLLCVTDLIDLSFNRLDKIEQFHFPRNCSLKVRSVSVFYEITFVHSDFFKIQKKIKILKFFIKIKIEGCEPCKPHA